VDASLSVIKKIYKDKNMATKLGIMGFGNIGRKIYSESLNMDGIEVSAICDIGNPEILEYLLKTEFNNTDSIKLDGNYLVNEKYSTRILSATNPIDVAWDVFGVDIIVDATGKFKSREDLGNHLKAGAKKVIISSLPVNEIDRVVVCGINEEMISQKDRIISAGSSTMNALALLVNALLKFGIKSINMTTIHSYTSDQSLQDVAGMDFRRSRSASENIIPNSNESERWISEIFPALNSKIICSALNVPVQKGSMIDLSISFEKDDISTEKVNDAIVSASNDNPKFIGYTDDPVVSSDIIGDPRSVVFDTMGTMKAGRNLVKVIGWYDNGHCHANRILDVVKSYSKLENY
tara:strand:- start:1546 stop:2592 length:1047 start_codon:yes stop_codon:yes gene_type:complete